MKLITMLIILLGVHVLAQVVPTPVTVATPAAVTIAAPAALSFLGQLGVFIKANWGEVAMILYVVLDALIYFIPSLAANGLLHQLELWLKGQSSGVPPASV